MKDLSPIIIVPTYNERENLPVVLTSIGREMPHAQIIVIDDRSPDGTGQIAADWSARCPCVNLVERSGLRGLGLAYRAGIEYAISLGAGPVVTMDCDLSHDPADIPRLIRATDGADLVIGSRFVCGGSTCHWPFSRRVISSGANQFAQMVTGITVKDATSGFRVYRPAIVRELLKYPWVSRGYSIQVELLWLAVKELHARVCEEPIVFRNRRLGTSKMGAREVLCGCGSLLRMRVLHRGESRRL